MYDMTYIVSTISGLLCVYILGVLTVTCMYAGWNKVYDFILTEEYILIQSHIKLTSTVGQSWNNLSG